ncbi:MAG: putative exported protein, partial [Herminiimonas sp.]|nr:putative exported protein [Herminiimonas sp.]
TPPDIIEKVSSEIATLLKSPDVQKKLEALGATPVGSTPEEFGNYVNDELKRWEKLIKPMNISLD